LLVAASNENASGGVEEGVLSFYSALAQQCFINEYVFAWTDTEAEQAHKLKNLLVAALASKTQIPVLWVLAAACYFPLNAVPLAEQFFENPWPIAVEDVLVQQVREPGEEMQYRPTITRLTPIDGEVSVLVQKQYEENPYPRWIKAMPVDSAETLDRVLYGQFPLSSFRPLGKNGDLDILVAGCGTGQQPINTAQSFRGAQVLALDLSLTSLCYAKRKTQELGLNMIEYAQADIMKLGSLGRNFDLIESMGVLHHLADPLAGWRVLLTLLRPGGFMRLAFYSEVARRGVVLARTFIAENGYGYTADDIRQCRQELMNIDKGGNFGEALKLADFYSTSDCRDLLFHVQEHRMTLTGIDVFLRENDLQFLGFENKPDVLRAYRLRFPEDKSATNLANWQIFENENPDTFIGMYQFWIQKPG
jgi:SAM-dependent methyltransferase